MRCNLGATVSQYKYPIFLIRHVLQHAAKLLEKELARKPFSSMKPLSTKVTLSACFSQDSSSCRQGEPLMKYACCKSTTDVKFIYSLGISLTATIPPNSAASISVCASVTNSSGMEFFRSKASPIAIFSLLKEAKREILFKLK